MLGESAEFGCAFPSLRAALQDISAALEVVLDEAEHAYAAATGGMPAGLTEKESARYLSGALPRHLAQVHWLVSTGRVGEFG